MMQLRQISLALIASLAAGSAAVAQQASRYTVPRTEHGHPTSGVRA
jgi:hypothetical protein